MKIIFKKNITIFLIYFSFYVNHLCYLLKTRTSGKLLLGKIYFHVILPNSFSYESVIKEIDNVFYIEKKVQLFPLEFWIVCISK